ncbi:MAG: hypothetical protein CMJ83_07920 [Planctomycetes bacterium]|nr:hypothetical protein [Planctomycetota bacterium]
MSARSVHFEKSASYGRIDGLEPYAVSDSKGAFRICHGKPVLRIGVHVSAPGLAPKIAELQTGGEVREVRLDAGATVTGRLLLDGKALPKVTIGLVQTNRGTDAFYGEMTIATDEKGRFTFRNVPRGFGYVLYGKMNSLGDLGATQPQGLRVDGATADVGDLPVGSGHRVAGHVVTTDAARLPEGVRVLVSADVAWDSQLAILDKNGRFSISGVPAGQYSLTVRVPGYRLSARNVSRKPSWPSSLEGRVDGDRDLKIELEPGAMERPGGFSRERWKLEQQLKKEPLRGVVEKPASPPTKKK